jgi:hypothetical protein
LARASLLMARRHRRPLFARTTTKPFPAIAMLGLMWVTIQSDVHNAIGRVIISRMVLK